MPTMGDGFPGVDVVPFGVPGTPEGHFQITIATATRTTVIPATTPVIIFFFFCKSIVCYRFDRLKSSKNTFPLRVRVKLADEETVVTAPQPPPVMSCKIMVAVAEGKPVIWLKVIVL